MKRLFDVFSHSCLDAFKTMEASLEDGSVRTYEHEMRNALYTINVCRHVATVVDMDSAFEGCKSFNK